MDSPSTFFESDLDLVDLTVLNDSESDGAFHVAPRAFPAQLELEVKEAIAEAIADEQNVFGTPKSESPRSQSTNSAASDSSSGSTTTKYCNFVVRLPTSTLVNPRSCFEGFVPPLPITKERHAVDALLELDKSQLTEDFIEFELDNFSMYVDVPGHPLELRSLHHHATKTGQALFFLDGILSIGETRYWVQKVPFDEVPLGNYGTTSASVGDQLWVRSRHNQTKEIYYRLRKPAVEYRRFHEPFLWVADLAKHFVDYCEYMHDKHRKVSIHNFKIDFTTWLFQRHKQSAVFRAWHRQRGSNDFRSAVVANRNFLYKEACGVLAGKARYLQVFREMDCSYYKPTGGVRSESDEKHPLTDESGSVLPTIVTPYIYDCFSHMQVGPYLKRVEPQITSGEAVRLSWPEGTDDWSFTRQVKKGQVRNDMIDSIRVGDTISTPPDGAHTGTKWKSVEGPDPRWFGIVQKVQIYKDGTRAFDVTWLYRPVDTPCCSMKYPWTNELFLSDHCTCQEGRDSKVHDNEILDTHSVEWLGTPDTKAEFFIRRLYEVEKRRFVTLKKSNIRCDHKQDSSHVKYRVGDTVLVATDPRKSDTLEPCEIIELTGKNNKSGFVRIRKLLRRRAVDPRSPKCPPNELVYTDELMFLRTSSIAGRCIVKVFAPEDQIPTPYDRNGTGNAFYMTHRRDVVDGVAIYTPLKDTPSLRQGFDPKKKVKQLQGLDLFCGCGNFGRGMEESGALRVRWTNDIWDVAINTYMANAHSQTGVSPFLGSVDDLLHRGLLGYYSENVPQPGEVDFVSGGSPCPGFSILTSDKTTAKQHKNRSLIASFASFIDFYRPKYGVLENVTTIVQKQKPGMGPTEDFFSQLICAIVGMGYQTQLILGDAWTHGAPQSRPRAFLYFAGPGLRLPDASQLSHSHPPNMFLRGLGRMTNGEPYVKRERVPTAFKFVSALEASADLPDIGDAKVNTCVPFPDHRLTNGISTGNTRAARGDLTSKNGRVQILNIPTRPYGMDFVKTWNGGHGVMTQAERETFPANGLRVSKLARSWGRHTPSALFPTITTACSYTDARIGGHLTHWDQPRPLTLMEARRAQGIPDDEVLLGTLGEQWKMMGNSVARQMALAMGLAFREAWLGSLYEGGEETDMVDAEVTPAPSVDELAAGDDMSFMDFPLDMDFDGFDDPIHTVEEPISTTVSKTPERNSLESSAGHTSSMATSMPGNELAIRPGDSVRKRPFSEMLARGSLSAKKSRLEEPIVDSSSDEDDILGPGERRGPTIVRLPTYDSDEDEF